MTLNLTITQEQLLIDNLDVFAKNGFAFRIDENCKIYYYYYYYD